MVGRGSQVGEARRHDEVLARHKGTLVHGHGISRTRRAHGMLRGARLPSQLRDYSSCVRSDRGLQCLAARGGLLEAVFEAPPQTLCRIQSRCVAPRPHHSGSFVFHSPAPPARRSAAARWPEMAAGALAGPRPSLLLDGAIAVCDTLAFRRGREWHRTHSSTRPSENQVTSPPGGCAVHPQRAREDPGQIHCSRQRGSTGTSHQGADPWPCHERAGRIDPDSQQGATTGAHHPRCGERPGRRRGRSRPCGRVESRRRARAERGRRGERPARQAAWRPWPPRWQQRWAARCEDGWRASGRPHPGAAGWLGSSAHATMAAAPSSEVKWLRRRHWDMLMVYT